MSSGFVRAVVLCGRIRKACATPEDDLSTTHKLLLANRLPGASVIQEAVDLLKSVRSGSEEQTILSFSAGHKQLKESRKRAADLTETLTEPALLALGNARAVLRDEWPVLQNETDLDPGFSTRADDLGDLLARETFYKELAAIGQQASALRAEYFRRHTAASEQRSSAYTAALKKVAGVPGWEELADDQRVRLIAPLEACATPASAGTGIALLRADTDACPGRTQKVIQEMLGLLDGNRLVRLDVNSFFSGGIETTEQLDTAIAALREECEKQLAEGKRILIQ